MTTPLEVRLDRVERTLATLEELVGRGPTAPPGTLRGRLHAVENTLHAADALADAAREMRKARRREWARWERIVAAIVALATAAAPYIVLVIHS